MSETKKCPYCAEDIKTAAIKCKHCKSDLLEYIEQPKQEHEEQPMPKDERPFYLRGAAPVIIALVFFLVFFIILAIVSSDAPETEQTIKTPEVVVQEEPEPKIEKEKEEEETKREFTWTFYHYDVTPDEFRNRWNNVIAGVGLGYTIGELYATDTDLYGFGGDYAVLAVGDWATLEILLHSDGYVGEIFLDAVPTTDEQGTDLIAMITALIAAVTGYDTEKSFDIALYDLGLDELSEGFHLELYEGEKADIRVYGDAFAWQISVEPHRQ